MNVETKAAIAARGVAFLKWVVPILLLMLIVSLFAPFHSYVFICTRNGKAKSEINGLVIAMKSYQVEYDKLPQSSQIFAVLEGHELNGDNPRRITFFEHAPAFSLPDGTPLDPWRHPYIFDGIVNDQPRFHSVGKDGIDQHGAEGSDDIVSWR